MDFIALSAFIVLAVDPVPVVAVSADQKSSVQPASVERNLSQVDPEKVICHKEKSVGSRIAEKKICKTAKQWEIEHLETRQATERVQSSRWKSE